MRAGLAAAGAIVQQVLRNPLASPTTLGVERVRGSRWPSRRSRLISARRRSGSGGIGGKRGVDRTGFHACAPQDFQPVATVIAGLVIALLLWRLCCLAGAGRRTANVGGLPLGRRVGEPAELGPFKALALRLGGFFLLLLPLIRPLGLLDLGADGARVGLPVELLRVAIDRHRYGHDRLHREHGRRHRVRWPCLSRIGAVGGRTAFRRTTGVVDRTRRADPSHCRCGDQRSWQVKCPEFLPTGAVTAVSDPPFYSSCCARRSSQEQPSLTALAWRAPPRLLVRLVPLALVLLVVVSLLVGRGPAGDWSISSRAQEVVMTLGARRAAGEWRRRYVAGGIRSCPAACDSQ